MLYALLGLLLLTEINGGHPAPGSPQAAPHENQADGLIVSPEPGWPQWRGPRRDGISAETGLLPKWPENGPRLLWQFDKLGRGWSSPIIVNDRLYITGDVGDDLIVFAFDLNGKPLWQVKNGKAWSGAFAGARASCVFSENKLYNLNAYGRVACLDSATGKELWACELNERFPAKEITWGLCECLLVDGDRLIVTPGSEKALMAALNKKTGDTVWTTEPLDDDSATYSAPLLFRHAGRRIIANCSSKHGFGVDADTGKLLWTVPLKSPYGVNVATPVYDEGRIFFVTAYFLGACYRLIEDASTQPEEIWKTTLDTCTGSVLLTNGTLYGAGYQKHKSWLSIDWKSGKTRYEFKELNTGSAVFADGRLYSLSVDGRVALLKPTAETFEVAGQFRIAPEDTTDAWAHPVLLNGRLYIRHHDTLRCYAVR